jgi:hypothetical protein
MSFFDSIPQAPPPEPEQRDRPVWMRPDTVIPGSVPAELLLVRTDQVAVAVGSVRAYPNGFEFTVHARHRGDQEIDLSGDPFSWHRRFRGAHEPGDALRLGLLYADGQPTSCSLISKAAAAARAAGIRTSGCTPCRRTGRSR